MPFRQRARRQLTELMAADAAVVLHVVHPVGPRDLGWNVGRSAEVALGRDLQHRVPVDRRIVLCGFGVVLRRHGAQVQLLAGLRIDLLGVDEAVAADPDLVLGLRQVGHDVAALVVGDHHLGVARRKVAGFRDHPYAGFWTIRPRYNAADVVVVDRHRGGGGLRLQLCRRPAQRESKRDGGYAAIQRSCHPHCVIPLSFMMDLFGLLLVAEAYPIRFRLTTGLPADSSDGGSLHNLGPPCEHRSRNKHMQPGRNSRRQENWGRSCPSIRSGRYS